MGPVYRTQNRMRTRLLGKDFWEKVDLRLPDIYRENLSHKGGIPPSDFEIAWDFVDLYCCTIFGCFDSSKIIKAEIDAGQATIAFERALGEFEPDEELVLYQKELEEKRARHAEQYNRKNPKLQEESDSEEEVKEVEVKDDDEEYGETSEHKAKQEELRGMLEEIKQKKREERKTNPRYLDQDHFDSEWYDYSDEFKDLGELSVDYDEYPDS